MKRILALLILALTTPAACGPTPDLRSSEKPIVAVLVAQSGPADFIGEPEAQVLEALVEDYERNGRPLPFRLEIRDSHGEPDQALSLFERLAKNQQVIAVIGPSTSGESIAVAQRAQALQVPLLSLAASKKIVTDEEGNINRWAFKFAQNDDLAAERLVSEMVGNGHASVALLFSDDGFGKSGAEVFRNAVKDSNLILQHESAFPAGLDAPEAYIAAIPSEIDAVLVWGTAPGPALLVRSLRSFGNDATLYLSHGNASPDFIAAAGTAAEGAILVGSHVLTQPRFLNASNPRDDVVARFQSFWRGKFRTEPSHFAGHARDALEALLAAAEDLESLQGDTREIRTGLRDAIERLHQFHGVTGTFSFSNRDHAGLTTEAFRTYRIRAGSFTPLDVDHE